jgi:hypothetical protein
MFHHDPILVLVDHQERALVSGLVGQIWMLRRDYPRLSHPDQFRGWSDAGAARVLFADWVQPSTSGGSVLHRIHRYRAMSDSASQAPKTG